MIVGMSSRTRRELNISADNNSKATNNGQLICDIFSDPEAFARLYHRHYDVVFRYCVHRLFEREAAEDVTSVVFLKVVENIDRFKGTEQQFRNWLYKIATNAVNGYLRKTARRNRLLKFAGEQITNESGDCKEIADENAEKLACLKQAMLTLKPKYQTIITLHFFENLKLTEIAEVLGNSSGTVRSQLARALAKLREKLATEVTEILD